MYDRIELPLPTSMTSRGPLVTVSPAVVVCYDHPEDDTTKWVRIEFIVTIALQLRREPCCTADDLEAWNVLLRSGDSPWLREVCKLRREFLGAQYDEQEDCFSHYRVYFDHSGCVEVIAESAVITGPFDQCPVVVTTAAT
jgi:hypothetical protein